MTTRKDYTLIGVGGDVQFGKGGGRFVWDTDHFVSTTDGTTLAQIRVPTLPVDGNDAASKEYVDGLFQGLDAKASVAAASTGPVTLASDLENGDTLDGVVLSTGDRVLVKDQADPTENGIYVVNATGAPTRATDADAAGDLSGGTFVFVEQGTSGSDTGWVISSNGSLTPGTDPVAFTQFSSAGVITAGIGLSQSGSVFNVNVGAATIAVDGSDDLIVNSSATAGQTLQSAGTVGSEATWGALDLALPAAVTGILPADHGGTGTDTSAFAAGSIMITNGSGLVTELAAATNGNVLRIAGGVPAYGTIDVSDNTNTITGVLDETNGGTGQSTVTEGDILIGGNAANTFDKLAIGANETILQSDGTTAAWVALPSTSGTIKAVGAVVPLNAAATVPLGVALPAGAYVLETSVNVTAASDAATTVVVGDTGQTDRLMAATANDPEDSSNYTTQCENLYAASTQLNAVVATPGTTGSATITVRYIQP